MMTHSEYGYKGKTAPPLTRVSLLQSAQYANVSVHKVYGVVKYKEYPSAKQNSDVTFLTLVLITV